MPKYLILPCVLAISMMAGEASSEVSIETDYPAGNIVLERVEGDDVYLHQDLRDTEGWWFYWNFAVRGAQGRSLRFHFTNRNVFGPRGPAFSVNEGLTWQWLGTGVVEKEDAGGAFSYAFSPDARRVRFSFAIPYVEADLQRFLARHAGNPAMQTGRLCTSREGRAVERIHLAAPGGAPEYRVLLTARHHACESMANYVLEGIMDTFLSGTPDGDWFRTHVEILALPFMDKDGVENGDQGKNRTPRDHGQDYAGESIYPSTRALRATVPEWAAGRLRIALDLHCPYIRGEYNEFIYMVGSASPAIWKEQCAFGRLLEAQPDAGLPYEAAHNLPFGERWNTEANYTAGKSMPSWAKDIPGIRLASTIEIPYANVGELTVTPENARQFGAALARAVRAYLENE